MQTLTNKTVPYLYFQIVYRVFEICFGNTRTYPASWYSVIVLKIHQDQLYAHDIYWQNTGKTTVGLIPDNNNDKHTIQVMNLFWLGFF